MEKSKIPSLRTPLATQKLAENMVPKALQYLDNNLPPKTLSTQRGLRRSKSFSDLKSMKLMSQAALKAPPPRRYGIAQSLMKSSSNSDIPNTVKRADAYKPQLKTVSENVKPRGTVLKPTTKRPAPTKTAAEDPAKPKVAKSMKPAPYDYKARYQLLNEKHTVLQEKCKGLKDNATQIEEKLVLFNAVQENYGKLQEEHVTVSKIKEELNVQNVHLIKELEIVNNDFNSLKKEHGTLQTIANKLQSENELLLGKNALLENELSTARNENEDLKSTVQTFKECIQSHEEQRRIMHNKMQDLKGNIRVFCRVRPSLPSEQLKMLCYINFLDEVTIEIKKSKESINCITGKSADLKLEYMFDKVFPPEATQMELFEELSQLVQSALDGYHICVFAYGQTGSGKTYTMQGENNDKQKLGMIPRTVSLIFELIQSLEKIGWKYEVQVNFLEIYNETIRDLLNPNDKGQHEIHFNEGKGITVTNLITKTVKSAEELRYLINLANRNRAVAATNYNEHSSRSHAVTKITVSGVNDEVGTQYVGSLSLVDLAGSESAKNSNPERMTETKNINKSLSTLGTVMSALHNKETHIPYRNSKLTYLLQSCLGGNSKTLMIVNVAPFEDCYSESVSVLRFAATVKEVKLGSRRNKTYLKRELSSLTK